ncbi:MAG: TonB-dependent receptor, partial [Croceibacterium sp.]
MRSAIGRNAAVLSHSTVVSLSALALASLWPSAAVAQGSGAAASAPDDRRAPAEPAAESTSGPAIIVTGSRLARSTFNTPSPVTVLGAEELGRLQVTNVGQATAQLPSFRPSTNPSTNGFGSFNVGAQIVNLRGLGLTRNLVLVDGRRFAPTTREGSVDLNFVPSTLVSRIEVVTGGASAAYGSDAIAGAVNVILDTKLNGLKAQVDYAISQEHDGGNLHAGLGFGQGFAGGAGHFVIGGEYNQQRVVKNCFTRDWCKVGGVVTNTGFAATAAAPSGNGQPNFVRSDTNAGWYITPSGVVSRFNNPAGVGNAIANRLGTGAITFGSNGQVVAAQQGTLGSGLSQIGGDLFPTYTDVDLIAPVKRYTTFGHLDYEFSEALRGFVEGSYGHVDGGTFQSAYFSSTIPIFADNPYIPQALRSQLPGFTTQPIAPATLIRPGTIGAPAVTSFNLGREFNDIARGFSRSVADSYRATAGLSGQLGSRFSWDTYYQYGRTDRTQTVDNNLVTGDPTKPVGNPTRTSTTTLAQSNARFFFAADAVVDPATGQVTCRALLSPDPALRTAAAGCVPINLFGAGNVTQQGKAYIYGHLREDIKLSQNVFAANLRGETGNLLAGPLSFAVGGEYRIDQIDVTHDALSNLYAYFQNFGSDYNGKTKVIEGYLEAELPILKDVPFFHSLILNGAIRQAHYATSGFGSAQRIAASSSFDATTWKVSGNWEPFDWLRFRATLSRDVRAPNFAELFLASAGQFTGVTNPFVLTSAGARTTDFPAIFNGGSPTVGPEKADTTTVGMVFSPRAGALRNLRVSVDGYRIKIQGYIGAVPGGAQTIVDRCFAGEAQFCALVNRDPASGALTAIRNSSINLDYILEKGIDFEADYRIPLSSAYSVQLRGIATYVDTLKTATLGTVVDRAGQTGGTAGLAAPHWLLNVTAALFAPQWNVTLQGRYIDKGLYDAQRIGPDNPAYATTLINSISDNRVDSRFYVNLFGSYFIDTDKR